MMTEISGTVENMSFKEGESQHGKWEKVSVKVNNEWYGAFKTKGNRDMLESVSKGDEVVVAYEQKGKFFNLTGIKLISKAAAPAPQTASQPSGAPVAVNHSQYRMSHAGGRNAAVGLITASLAHDANFSLDDKDNRIISLPKAQNKRLDALVALTETLGVKLGMQNWTAEPQEEEDDDGDYAE